MRIGKIVAGLWLVTLVVLTGCTDGAGFLADGMPEVTRRTTDKISVLGRSVVIAGPAGYCIDRPAKKETANSAFVLLGNCEVISPSRGRPAPRTVALLMASVSEGGYVPVRDQLAKLETFFKSEGGRAALSRAGSAQSVRVLETKRRDGILFLHVRDSSSETTGGGTEEYWRAIFDVNQNIVSASVVAPHDRPIARDAGLVLVESFAARIISENAKSSGSVVLAAREMEK